MSPKTNLVRHILLLLGTTALASGAAATELDPAAVLQRAPCVIEKVVSEAEKKAADETAQFSARKNVELDSAEQRATRSDERIKNGDNFTWEGGGSRQRYSVDLPQVTVRSEAKSFDFVQTAMKETRTKFGRFEACWWKVRAGFIDIKTKGTCWRESDIVWSVPQFRWGRIEINVPSIEVGWKRQDFIYDLPTVTVRDNKEDLDKANKDINRTKKELEDGTAEIQRRVEATARENILAILDGAAKESEAAIEVAQNKAVEPLRKQRQDLSRSRDAARATLAPAGKSAEADAAFAEAFKMIDKSEADVMAGFETAKQNARKQIAALREKHVAGGSSAAASCRQSEEVTQ